MRLIFFKIFTIKVFHSSESSFKVWVLNFLLKIKLVTKQLKKILIVFLWIKSHLVKFQPIKSQLLSPFNELRWFMLKNVSRGEMEGSPDISFCDHSKLESKFRMIPTQEKWYSKMVFLSSLFLFKRTEKILSRNSLLRLNSEIQLTSTFECWLRRKLNL